MRFGFWVAVLAAVAALVAGVAWTRLGTPASGGVSEAASIASAIGQPAPPPPLAPSAARYLVVGGGPTPESTEVSLEQDVGLFVRNVRGPGVVLFAGGSSARTVRQLDPALGRPSLLTRLGDVFEPRAGRRSRYRQPRLSASAASLDAVHRVLSELLTAEREPLLFYIAAHGERGRERADSSIPLWGGERLTVKTLVSWHDDHPRPLRLIVAACFSGGFAEMAFTGADPANGITRAPRCGLFAGPWDRETTGCDPNPDRRAQEGYSLHMVQALDRRDKNGDPLQDHDVDFDGDGRVTLLEAHTRARIASVSIDVPTTTSERYLRSLANGVSDATPAELPEERAVIRALGSRLGAPSRAQAELLWKRLHGAVLELDAKLSAAEDQLDRSYGALSARLLGRWPVLDDAYHQDFRATLTAGADEIVEVLDSSPEAQRYQRAEQTLAALEQAFWDAQVLEATALRLLRAHETASLAGALERAAGSEWAAYQRLLECERSEP